MRLVPRVARELVPKLLLVVRRDGERHPVVDGRAAEEEEAALGERVHVGRVLLPQRLLLHRLAAVPGRAGLRADYEEDRHRTSVLPSARKAAVKARATR